MTVKTRETLMQRAMTGKPIMGQELRDLIDTMFWLKATPEQRSAEVVKQVVGRSSPAAAEFPDVPGTGFVKIGADRKWFTDPTVYLTQQQGDQFYFRNALFPMEPALYLAGDKTFQNFVDSARAAFTGGDGIDIVAGDIRVDSTVSRVGHQHTLTLSGDVSGSGPVTGTVSTTVNAIRGGVVPPPGTAGYFYWTGSSYSWVGTPPPTTIALDDLADVALASVAAGQVLWYDGSVGQWINKTMVANDLPTHASRHHWGGSDPLTGNLISGLRVSDKPTYAGLIAKVTGTAADIDFYSITGFRQMSIRYNATLGLIELFSSDDTGGARANRILIPRSSSDPVSILLGLTVTGTTTLSTSLTGMLKATAGVVSVAGSSDLPLHATRHHWDGADPITGQLLNGLRSHETPSFGGIKSGSVTGYLSILGNTGTEIARFNSSGFVSFGNITLSGDLSIANLTGILYAQNGLVRVALGTDLPSHNHVASNISDSGAMGRLVLQMATATDLRTSILFGQTPIILDLSTGKISHSNADGSKHVPANGTTNSGKVLVASSSPGLYTWENLGVTQIPSHASKHHSGGSDPLSGQSIAGLLTTSSPVFADLSLDGSLWLRNSGVRNWSIFGSNAFELASRNSDGSAIDWPIIVAHAAAGTITLGGSTSRLVNVKYALKVDGQTTLATSLTGMLKATSGVISVAGASDLPSHASRHHSGGADPLAGQSIAGLLPSSSPEFAGLKIGALDGILKASFGVVGVATGADLPSHASRHYWNGGDPMDGQSLSGLLTSSSPTFAGLTIGSLNGMLKATAGVLAVASASDLPAHASRHHYGGSDPLVGQSIAGLLTTDSPTWNALTVTSIKIGALNGILKATAGVVSVAGAASIDASLVNVPYGRIPFGGSNGLTWSDKLRWNDPYTDMFWVDASATFRGTVYADDLQLPIDGSIVSFSAVMIQFGDGVTVPRVLFPNTATNKAFQVDGLATFAHIDAYLLEGDVQPDRDTIISGGSRTLPTADSVGKSVRFCAGIGPGTYTVSVETPASEVILYRSRTTGAKLSATSLDIVDSATEFVCHEVGRWTAIGY